MAGADRKHARTLVAAVGGLLLVLAGGCSAPSRVGLDSVLEPGELAEALSSKSRADVRILDARDAGAYDEGHVAGAVRMDVDEWKALSLGEATGLDDRDAWYPRIGALGVGGDDAVVVYDDGRMTDAARVWFILQHFGVAEAAVVNGGYPALEPLIADGRIAVSREPVRPRAVEFRPSFAARKRIGLADRQQVREDVHSGKVQILDARTPGEYGGSERGPNPRGGHLPGAKNLPHKELLDEHGRLRPRDELAEIFQRAGFERGRAMVTYCQSGGRSSLAALAAARAGYGPVWNYYLSFGDWAKDATCPVVGQEGEER